MELLDALGKVEGDIDLITLLRKSGATVETRPFNDCVYLNFKDNGISFCFKPDLKGHLDSIFLYNENIQGFKQFKGELPFGLNWKLNNVDVVNLLGEPEGKPKPGGKIPIYVDYQRRGVQIDFKSPDYEDRSNPITCICVYKPS